jgi:UDP-4-amino-4,6-dideoxy-N-acetyl-beta-L-altrosamine transaminase
MIPYGRQDVVQADIDSVVEVLRSDWLTQGPAVERFESAIASYCGAAHGVAVNSATSALHIACLALGLGPGDVLWTSPNTFLASANCARYCGANVDFVDIDPRTYNLCPEALGEKLAQATKDGRLPKILVAVHFAGQSCAMREVRALTEQHGVRVIEDASHAIGGRYLGQPIGNCRFSDVTVFSFHPVKLITTAEGGMALTNDPNLKQRLQLFRSHGMTRDPSKLEDPTNGAWYYEQIELGYNYRLTDLQAVLGVSQLERLDEYVRARHGVARRYADGLHALDIVLPWQSPDSFSALHLYPIQVPSDRRREVFDAMRLNGVGVNVHYIPVHTQPYYRRLGFRIGDFPRAEAYYERAISLPMFPTLSHGQQARVIEVLRAALS